MQYLYSHSLYISNNTISIDFYTKKLGMNLIKQFIKDEKEYFHLCFEENSKQAILELIYDKNNKETLFPKNKEALEGYWKIAISIKDVDIARQKLLENDVKVSEAFQVPNVAYLCHFEDPDGYTLELIQHKFQENHEEEKADENYVLGNKAVLSLITYRVKNIKKSLDFYTKKLGLKILSKMDVKQRGFDLYFLAANDITPPSSDIESIKNVQWLWQRDFTIIELQHILHLQENEEFSYDVSKKTGFNKITFISNKQELLKDPDSYKIELKKEV